MRYDFTCISCENVQEEECSMNTFKEFRPKCVKCGAECQYTFTPTVIQFVLKDGPSGSWPSKGNSFKQYRVKQSEKVKKRQQKRYGHQNRDVTPNYGGQICENWSEAQSLAVSDKDNSDPLKTASTYTEKIAKEKTIKISK